MEDPEQKSLWEESEEYGGWRESYKKLSLVGLLMMGLGGLLILATYFLDIGGEVFRIISMILLGIGLFVAVPGAVGYLDEKKKEGKERIRTKEGMASVVLLLLGLIVLSSSLLLFLILNLVAIIFGFRGIKKGDNTIAIAGFGGGIIMYIIVAIMAYFLSAPLGLLENLPVSFLTSV